MFRAILELGPIVIAVFATLTASFNYIRANKAGKRYTRMIAMLSMISCIMMIVAQSSWYVLVVVMNSLEDSVYSNYLWTVFNCLIMILIILINKVNTENVPTESVTPRHQNS
jgi:hypothetical protein